MRPDITDDEIDESARDLAPVFGIPEHIIRELARKHRNELNATIRAIRPIMERAVLARADPGQTMN